jgi:hypothetical protein
MNCINHSRAKLFIYGWKGYEIEETLGGGVAFSMHNLPTPPCTVLQHSHKHQGLVPSYGAE